MSDTLLLNADYRPHSLITWRDAVVLVHQDKARVVERYPDWEVSSPSMSMQVPSVLVLQQYVVFRQDVKFNRSNIYSRDDYKCQYCGRSSGSQGSLSRNDLTFDHVIPKSEGGKTTWKNIVTACHDCNVEKGNRTPDEANMEIDNEPYKPTQVNNVEFQLSHKSFPESWELYLSFDD